MFLKLKLFASVCVLVLFNLTAQAQQSQILDQIVAVVNDHIILQSDVDQRVHEYMQGMNIDEFDEQLWYQVLESMIDNFVLVEKAKIDSVEISDDQVNRMLNQRIDQLVERAGGERELEQAFGSTILQIQAEYRDIFRQDMLVERVRQQRLERINITRPEVIEFFESIPQDSLPVIPESVALSQIVVVPPPKAEAEEDARRLAVQLRDSIVNYGRDIEELARRYSDGPTASGGGRLPMVPTSDLVTEYAAAASALDPGEISEVVSTAQGYHIIRLNERSGDNISTNHILIRVQDRELDDDYAIEKLTALRDSVINHGKDFATLARTHSEDRNTAPSGGRLIDPQTGQRRIEIDRLDPALARIARSLEEGEISEPSQFRLDQGQGRAYRVVMLREYVPQHVANLDMDYDLIRNFALQQKQQLELMSWMQRVRNEVYVEYRIPVPDFDPLPPEVPAEMPTEAPVNVQDPAVIPTDEN